jgi:hypothetical protein
MCEVLSYVIDYKVYCSYLFHYVFTYKQGVKHCKYFSIYNEDVEEEHRLNVDVQKRRLIFTKCIMCESLKDLISELGKNNTNVK